MFTAVTSNNLRDFRFTVWSVAIKDIILFMIVRARASLCVVQIYLYNGEGRFACNKIQMKSINCLPRSGRINVLLKIKLNIVSAVTTAIR